MKAPLPEGCAIPSILAVRSKDTRKLVAFYMSFVGTMVGVGGEGQSTTKVREEGVPKVPHVLLNTLS